MDEAQTMTRDQISAMIATRAWQDEDFRARVLTDANSVFEEETDSKLPPGVKLKVVEDDASTIHFVIPAKPSNSEELSDDELESVAGGATPVLGAIGATIGGAIGAGVFGKQILDKFKPGKWR